MGSENFTARRETAFLIVSQAPHTQTSEAAADENRVENSVRDTECSLDIALGAVGEKVTEPVICLWRQRADPHSIRQGRLAPSVAVG